MSAPVPPFIFPTDRFRNGGILPPMAPVAVNRLRGGAVKARTVGASYFEGRWETVPIALAERARWHGFFANLRSGGQVFLGYDTERILPMSYSSPDGLTRHSGAAFDWTATLLNIASSRELDVSGLPTAFSLKAGDWLGVEENGRYFLTVIAQDAVAVAGIITVFIEPALPSQFSTAGVVNFLKPKAEFVIDPASISVGKDIGLQPVSFSGFSVGF